MTIQISAEHKNLLVEEVLIQANLALRAYEEFRNLIGEPETRQLRECWSHMQSLLSHTAMISKFMQPTRNSEVAQRRAEVLKNVLNVAAHSAIFNRNARNNVEHLDERLDRWISADAGRLLEMVFDNRNGYNFLNRPGTAKQPRWFVKRVYLIEEDTFISEGRGEVEEIDISTLAAELRRIQGVAEQFLNADEAVIRVGPLGR